MTKRKSDARPAAKPEAKPAGAKKPATKPAGAKKPPAKKAKKSEDEATGLQAVDPMFGLGPWDGLEAMGDVLARVLAAVSGYGREQFAERHFTPRQAGLDELDMVDALMGMETVLGLPPGTTHGRERLMLDMTLWKVAEWFDGRRTK